MVLHPTNDVAGGSGRRVYTHTLSVRLTDDLYRRLRRFVSAYEEESGQRLTHQAVLEEALARYLGSD